MSTPRFAACTSRRSGLPSAAPPIWPLVERTIRWRTPASPWSTWKGVSRVRASPSCGRLEAGVNRPGRNAVGARTPDSCIWWYRNHYQCKRSHPTMLYSPSPTKPEGPSASPGRPQRGAPYWIRSWLRCGHSHQPSCTSSRMPPAQDRQGEPRAVGKLLLSSNGAAPLQTGPDR